MVDPTSVQTLMCHSDPLMTFGVYVHSDKSRLVAARQKHVLRLDRHNCDLRVYGWA